MRVALVLRFLALVIAILAAIDPVLTRTRSDQPFVAVIAATRGDSAGAARIRDALAGRFRPLDQSFGAASAAVIVGEALPNGVDDLAGPVFVVAPASTGPRLAIERIAVPNGGAFEAAAGVTPSLRGFGVEAGRVFDIDLRTDGALAVTASARAGASGAPFTATLPFPPSRHEAMLLRLEAKLTGAASAIADVAYVPGVRQWKVLFHDARASWASTFVRRAAERDGQFFVSSRIATTRNVVSGANAPARLDDRASLEGVDVVVVGAAQQLGESDVAALEWFLRDRGGSVVLLLDDFASTSTSALSRLAGTGAWTRRSGGDPLVANRVRGIGEDLRAIEMTWPERLPAGAAPIAVANVVTRGDTARSPVVWGVDVGAGHLVVSGALDAWRYRDVSQSQFEKFWRSLLSEEAGRAVPAVEVELTPSVVSRGERISATVRLRSAGRWSGAPLSAAVSGVIRDTRAATKPVRLWPGNAAGTFVTTFRAPDTTASFHFEVVSGSATGSAPFVVTTDPRPAHPVARAALAWFAQSTGGAAVTEGELAGAIASAIKPAESREPWRPMRNPLWIVPFALLLSAEWWIRRRRGLR